MSLTVIRGQLFKTFNLDQNDPDLEIQFFLIQDQVLCRFFKATLHWITLIQIHSFQDYPIQITSALIGTTYHNVGYQLCKEQVEELTWSHCKCFLF